MSTALAIASVTHVLKDLLNNGIIDHDVTGVLGGNVAVSALPPDRIDITATNQQSRLNLFMYQAMPNQGWRNVGLPSCDASGERIANPPLALNLHYLLTAYGAEELHCEILLGYGMQLLHETPVLVPDAIRRALAPPLTVPSSGLPVELQALSASELAEQFEQIKITPESLNTEEMFRLWSALQSKYRPSAAYLASVVLIQNRKSTKSALPVRRRDVHIMPFKQPVIRKIMSQAAPEAPIVENQPILAGYRLVITGSALKGDDMLVAINGFEIVPAMEDISDEKVAVPLPPVLQAGVRGVQVIHRVMMGSPPFAHRGIESNISAFVFRPSIQSASVANVQNIGNGLRSADLHLIVTPAIGTIQRLTVLLNELLSPLVSPTLSETPQSYSFSLTVLPVSPPFSTTTVTVPISGINPGEYLVRIQVDGAESPLGVDSAGRYITPRLSIP